MGHRRRCRIGTDPISPVPVETNSFPVAEKTGEKIRSFRVEAEAGCYVVQKRKVALKKATRTRGGAIIVSYFNESHSVNRQFQVPQMKIFVTFFNNQKSIKNCKSFFHELIKACLTTEPIAQCCLFWRILIPNILIKHNDTFFQNLQPIQSGKQILVQPYNFCVEFLISYHCELHCVYTIQQPSLHWKVFITFMNVSLLFCYPQTNGAIQNDVVIVMFLKVYGLSPKSFHSQKLLEAIVIK